MHRRRRLFASCATPMLAAIIVAACTLGPTPAPTSDDVSVIQGVVVGCLSFEQQECEAVARQVLGAVPAGRGRRFSVVLQLYDCVNPGACPKSLTAREGQATIEFTDGGEPIVLGLTGPPVAVRMKPLDVGWTGLIQPQSARVAGPGPFPFELGHCGLTWQVDFDGSFWVPVGQIDGEEPAIINADAGHIRLLGETLAVYTGAGGFTAGLQRFPGPKHIWMCR